MCRWLFRNDHHSFEFDLGGWIRGVIEAVVEGQATHEDRAGDSAILLSGKYYERQIDAGTHSVSDDSCRSIS